MIKTFNKYFESSSSKTYWGIAQDDYNEEISDYSQDMSENELKRIRAATSNSFRYRMSDFEITKGRNSWYPNGHTYKIGNDDYSFLVTKNNDDYYLLDVSYFDIVVDIINSLKYDEYYSVFIKCDGIDGISDFFLKINQVYNDMLHDVSRMDKREFHKIKKNS